MDIRNVTRQGERFEVPLIRSDNTVNRPKPPLYAFQVSKLKSINPHMEFIWNGLRGIWEVWFNDRIGMPYIVTAVRDENMGFRPIDERVFKEIRHALQWSTNIKYNINKMHERMLAHRAKREADKLDDNVQMGKELAPLVKTLADANGSSHGRSKFLFPGIGNGKVGTV